MNLAKFKKIFVALSLLIAAAVFYVINSSFKETREPSLTDNFQLQTTTNGSQIFPVTERFIIIFITSAPFHTNQRKAIRQTWLSLLVNSSVALGRSNVRAMKNPTNASNNDLVIHYWFVCGHYYDKKKKVEAAVENESKVYGDILRLNYTEAYSLLVHKTLSSLWLASTMDFKFVVKVDDDVYLHVPRMTWWLKTAPLPDKLYAGQVLGHAEVIRKPEHKWYVSKQDFEERHFPPYCNGPFYILSKTALLKLLKVSSSDNLSPLLVEDAYIGVLAKRAAIKALPLHRARIGRLRPNTDAGWEDKKLNQYFALGHGLTSKGLFAFHKRFVKLPLIML